MENVPEAPAASVTGYETTDARVNNRWLGEEQNRMRRFSFGHRGGRSSQFYAELTREFAVFESPIYAPAVCASGGTRAVPVALGGSGKIKSTRRVRAPDEKTERSFVEARRLQGLPADFLDESPFTVAGKIRLVGNGVPIPMGRAVARAVKRCLGLETEVARVG
jgi:DNA (cytosine-5)-methyltransferase 1